MTWFWQYKLATKLILLFVLISFSLSSDVFISYLVRAFILLMLVLWAWFLQWTASDLTIGSYITFRFLPIYRGLHFCTAVISVRTCKNHLSNHGSYQAKISTKWTFQVHAVSRTEIKSEITFTGKADYSSNQCRQTDVITSNNAEEPAI